jgi:hypothetical protein
MVRSRWAARGGSPPGRQHSLPARSAEAVPGQPDVVDGVVSITGGPVAGVVVSP